MALGKYCKIDGDIKQVVSEHTKVGGVIVPVTINAVDIAGIKQIPARTPRCIYRQ